MPKLNQQGLIPIILLLIIVLASAIVVKNVANQGPQPADSGIHYATSSGQLKASPSSQGLLNSLINTLSAPKLSSSTTSTPQPSSSTTSSNSSSGTNSSPSPSTTSPSPSPSPTPSSITTTNNGITTTAGCSGSSMTLSISGNIPYVSGYQGIWSALIDTTTNQSMIYEYDGQGPTTTHIAANFPPTGPINGSPSVSLVGDGRIFAIKVYAGADPTHGLPSQTNPVAQTTFSKTCP